MRLSNRTQSMAVFGINAKFPNDVYKPSKGLFRLTKFRKIEEPETPVTPPKVVISSVKEEDFYKPFAEWLKNDIEDVTDAIALGRNKFKDKWGTPDVIGKRESRRSDIIKGPTEIVSAEIKTDSAQLVTAFGQACAYKLFSHKAYLVVPRQSSQEEISRVDYLCQIFGIGFVIFDARTLRLPISKYVSGRRDMSLISFTQINTWHSSKENSSHKRVLGIIGIHPRHWVERTPRDFVFRRRRARFH